jgi:4-hydroxybenzoate polyprenyltransferase
VVTLAVLAGQLSVGWHNDWTDAARDIAANRREKPIVRADLSAHTVALAAASAGVATIPLSFASGWRAGGVHIVAVATALSYNGALKFTPLSVVPYAISFGLLPVFVIMGLPGAPLPPWWMPVATALLGTGAHFLNTIPDRETDLVVGVRGLPQRLSVRANVRIAAVLIATSSVTLSLGPGRPDLGTVCALVATLLLLGVAIVDATRSKGRSAFQITLVIALIDVGVLIAQGRHAA